MHSASIARSDCSAYFVTEYFRRFSRRVVEKHDLRCQRKAM
jgi:hypothetical protein